MEVVTRAFIQFDEDESNYLRACNFLHPESSPSTGMWMTLDEIENMAKMFPDLSERIRVLVAQLIKMG